MAEQDKTTDSNTNAEAGETRYDYTGAIRAMAVHDNWVMCRRPRCSPWCLHVKDWLKLSTTNECVGKTAAPRAMHYGVLA